MLLAFTAAAAVAVWLMYCAASAVDGSVDHETPGISPDLSAAVTDTLAMSGMHAAMPFAFQMYAQRC